MQHKTDDMLTLMQFQWRTNRKRSRKGVATEARKKRSESQSTWETMQTNMAFKDVFIAGEKMTNPRIDNDCDHNTVLSWDEDGEKPGLNMPMTYEQNKHFFGRWSLRQSSARGSCKNPTREHPELSWSFQLKPKRVKHHKDDKSCGRSFACKFVPNSSQRPTISSSSQN